MKQNPVLDRPLCFAARRNDLTPAVAGAVVLATVLLAGLAVPSAALSAAALPALPPSGPAASSDSMSALGPSGFPGPVQADGDVPTFLYMHMLGPDMPMNTQVPPGAYPMTPQATTTCVPAVSGTPARAWHTWTAYPTPGLVDHDALGKPGPAIARARGIADDVFVSPDAPWVLRWYLEVAPPHESLQAGPPPPAPRIVVSAEVRSGNGPYIPQDQGRGDLLARAASDPVTLAGDHTYALNPAHEGYEGYTRTEDGRDVYAFALTFPAEPVAFAKEEGFRVRIDAAMEVPGCDGGDRAVAPASISAYADALSQPRMEFLVRGGLRVEYVHAEWLGDRLAVHAAASSPWGEYDVALRLQADNGTLAPLTDGQSCVGGCRPGSPRREAGWEWKPDASRFGRFLLVVTSLQGSSTAIPMTFAADGTFHAQHCAIEEVTDPAGERLEAGSGPPAMAASCGVVAGWPAKESSGVPWAMAAAGLMASAVAWRRRHR